MSYQSISISSGGVSVVNISGGSVNISNSNGGSIRCSTPGSYVSISNNGIRCYTSGSSISITNSNVFTNTNNTCIVAPKKKKSSKSPKQPKPPKLPKLPKLPSAKIPKAPPLPSVRIPKALPPPPPSVASSTNRNIQPEDGYCWLLLFKSKYWNTLRSTFGPNTIWYLNTPDNVLRTFMSQNPHMVSSRRDLLQRQTGPNLYHITPGGSRSPWNIMGL